MDVIKITGGKSLRGTVQISGAKNAALPMMTASLLTKDPLVLTNVPPLADIITMTELLRSLGTTVDFMRDENIISLTSSDISNKTAQYEIVRKMRASIWVLGPLLTRFGEAVVSLPGGCAIGTRPIDLHLAALTSMGAIVNLKDGYVHATAPHGLSGAHIYFDKVSVGATMTAMMAATLAKGQTVISNAAKEPEIMDTAKCLKAMGAHIEGCGTDTIVVEGVKELHGATYQVMPDRIEAATYAIAALITNGDIELDGAVYEDLENVLQVLQKVGADITVLQNGNIRIRRGENGKIYPTDITTAPYPGFPTDAQAQFMSLMAIADGSSVISETVFENRFMHVPELMRMGANIVLKGNNAVIKSVEALYSANVMATDLRASVSLVLAALAADGSTLIHRVYHLDRGYYNLEQKLRNCGAVIERITSKEVLDAGMLAI